jgi:hypothetical protein
MQAEHIRFVEGNGLLLKRNGAISFEVIQNMACGFP